MAIRKSFVIFSSLLVLLACFVAATADVTYTFDQNSVDVRVYTCLDYNCYTVGGWNWQGSTSNGRVVIPFPSSLQSQYGYAMYFTTHGYIPKEGAATWRCTSGNQCSAIGNGGAPVRFNKVQLCRSVIDSFSVTNYASPSLPLIVGMSAAMDADTHSAFRSAFSPVQYVPPALKDEYYSADTKVHLSIDKSGDIVKTEDRFFTQSNGNPIYLESSKPVSFSWLPQEEGEYTATLTTTVIDNQCLAQQDMSAWEDFSVLQNLPRNQCYSILNNLETSSIEPREDSVVSFSFDKITNYANNYDYLSPDFSIVPLQTAVTYSYRNTRTGETGSQSIVLPANADEVTPTQHAFTFTFPSYGMYEISVNGRAASCPSGSNIADAETMQLYILPPETYQVKFFVKDSNGIPLPGATVQFNSAVRTTAGNGVAVFNNTAAGTYSYTVSKAGYESVSSTLQVDGNEEEIVFLGLINNAPVVSDIRGYSDPDRDPVSFEAVASDPDAGDAVEKVEWQIAKDSLFNELFTSGVSTQANWRFDFDSSSFGEEFNGIVHVRARAFDGEDYGNWRVESFLLDNDAPYLVLAIPDKIIEENSGLNDNLVDLWQYFQDNFDTDEQVTFGIVSESNAALVHCVLDGDRYLDCTTTASISQDQYSDVTVSATDRAGNMNTDTFRITIKNDAVPTANLDADPVSGDAPLEVEFSCTGTGGNAPLSYRLNYGDGSAALALNSPITGVLHTYSAAGSYEATCTVSDADGDDDDDSTIITVRQDSTPSVSCSAAPDSGDAPLPVQFSATGTGGDGTLTYRWDFGDGGVSTQRNPAYTYDEPGHFWAFVTVRDADGDEDNCEVGIDVTTLDHQITDVVADVTPLEGFAGVTEFDYTCTATGGDAPLSYSWSFSDGSSSTAQNPTKMYASAGTYTAQCTVTDNDGDHGSDAAPAVSVRVNTVPVVQCSAEPQSGIVPLDVAFSASVVGGNGALTYHWNFGDGSTSTELHATHRYTEGGVYQSTLVVEDEDGESGDCSVEISVGEDDAPQAELIVSDDAGVAPFQTTLTCTGSGGNAPLSYQLNFGDESAIVSASTPITQLHTYAAGTYQASCTVEDADGDDDTDSGNINVVADTTPSLRCSATPTSGLEPLNVILKATGSGGNGVLDYSWDFGDGNGEEGQQITHIYTGGDYEAIATVVDEDGDSEQCSVDIHVENDEGVFDVVVDANPRSGLAPLAVQFSCSASGGNAPLSYYWEFDDGTSSSVQNPTHTYTFAGVFDAICVVTDHDGDSNFGKVAVSVRNAQCSDDIDNDGDDKVDYPADPGCYGPGDDNEGDDITVRATATPTSGLEPLNVQFGCTATGGSGSYQFSWRFGDGSQGSGASPVHRYPMAGVFEPTCVVRDSNGQMGEGDAPTIMVADDTTPIADLIVDDLYGVEPYTVTLTCTGTGGNIPLHFRLDYGDGTPAIQSSSPITQQHTYYQGTYTASCYVEDVDGDFNLDDDILTIRSDEKPHASLTLNPSEGKEPLQVQIGCTGTGGNAPLSYSVDFGDGGAFSSTAPISVSHVYDKGNYIVACHVEDSDGDVATDSDSVHVRGAECNDGLDNDHDGKIDYPADPGCYGPDDDNEGDDVVVSVTAQPLSGVEPLPVSFTCTATGGSGIYTYAWTFGDGDVSTQRNPSHTYVADGSYTSECTATDSRGQNGKGNKVITVQNDAEPTVFFTVNSTSGVRPHTAQFVCGGSGGNAPLTFRLDFGDGSQVVQSNQQISVAHTYSAVGQYTAVCKVTDADGDMVTDDEVISVRNPQCSDGIDNDQDGKTDYPADPGCYGPDDDNEGDDLVVVALANPTSGIVPLNVSFTCTATGGNGGYTYSWIFGDGSSLSTVQNPVHIYSQQGNYTATCKVVDSKGQKGEDNTDVISVRMNIGPSVNITEPLNGSKFLAGRNITFSAVASDPDGTIARFAWKIDGVVRTDMPGYPQNIMVNNLQPGQHLIEITVTDNDGYPATDSVTIFVVEDNLIAQIYAVPQSGLVPLRVEFTAIASGPGVLTYSWDFDDSDGIQVDATTVTTQHIYMAIGTYNVTLNVLSDGGATGNVTVSTQITVYPFVPTDTPKRNIIEEDMVFERIAIERMDDGIQAGKQLQIGMVLRNAGEVDLDHVVIQVSIPELSIRRKIGPFDLATGEATHKAIVLDIPKDAEAGTYYVRIIAHNALVKTSLHRTMVVLQGVGKA